MLVTAEQKTGRSLGSKGFFFFFNFFLMLFLSAYILFMYVCMYVCMAFVGSSFLCEGFLQLWQAGATLHRGAGATLHRGARAFHHRGPPPLPSTGSRCTGSAIVAHGPSRSTACGILPDQGSNPRALHWQADSQPLRHQGSPGSRGFYEREKPHQLQIAYIWTLT